MKRLTIVWHSRTGAARQMAEACAAAARDEGGVAITLLAAEQAAPADLLMADGLVLAAPENLGSLSGAMKECLDRCYYPVLGQLEGRPYALLIAAGTDGAGAVRQAQRIVTGWRLRAIAEPVIVRNGAQSPAAIAAAKQLTNAQLAPCQDLGTLFAAGLAAGVF